MGDGVLQRSELVRLMKVAGFRNQQAFADSIGMSPPQLSNVLAKKRHVQLDEAERMAAALNISQRVLVEALGITSPHPTNETVSANAELRVSLHPAIFALFKLVPVAGHDFPMQSRIALLRAMAAVLDAVYGHGTAIEVREGTPNQGAEGLNGRRNETASRGAKLDA